MQIYKLLKWQVQFLAPLLMSYYTKATSFIAPFMKKMLSVVLCSLLLASPVLAKSGSGGQPKETETQSQSSTPDPEPAEESVDEPAPTTSDPLPVNTETESDPIDVPKEEEEKSAPPSTSPQTLPNTTSDSAPSSAAQIGAVSEIKEKPEVSYADCAEKGRGNVREGVTCFMSLPNFYSQETFQSFKEDSGKNGKVSDQYQPLGCAYTSDNTRCRQLYWNLYEAGTYDKSFGKPVINSAKEVVGLPSDLKPLSKECDEDQSCRDEYTHKVTSLVGARLYLAQQQALKWYDAGQLPKTTFKEFLIFIVEAKHRFYPSNSITEQKAIMQEAVIQWKKLAQVAKENELNPLDNSY